VFTAFGSACAEKFEHFDAENTNRKNEIVELRKELEGLKAKVDSGAASAALPTDLRDRVAAVEEELVKSQRDRATPVAESNGQHKSDWLHGIPESERKYARIGNLGWDEQSPTLIKRAKELLEKIGVQADEYSCLSAVRNPGSLVGLTFKSADRLQEAKRAVRALCATAPGAKNPMWLDIEKSRKELAPARLIHRAFDMVTELEGARPDGKTDIEKKMNGKQIKVGGTTLVCWSFHGQLQWSNWAQKRYSAEEIQQVTAYCEN